LSITKKKEIIKIGESKKDEIAKEAERQKEISVLWNKGNEEYNAKEFESALQIWQQLYKDYNLKVRPLFNMWGSTLLGLAKQKKDTEREKLLKEAAEKYKKAEEYTCL
jgi:hypothetical protein